MEKNLGTLAEEALDFGFARSETGSFYGYDGSVKVRVSNHFGRGSGDINIVIDDLDKKTNDQIIDEIKQKYDLAWEDCD